MKTITFSKRNQHIFDYKHVKSVSVFVLLDKESKEVVGKIISNWSDNPNLDARVCTSQVMLYKPRDYGIKPHKVRVKTSFCEYEADAVLIGKDRGDVYCKLSSSIATAIRENAKTSKKIEFDEACEGDVISWFDKIGIAAIYVL